jgi:hypothetical protein
LLLLFPALRVALHQLARSGLRISELARLEDSVEVA